MQAKVGHCSLLARLDTSTMQGSLAVRVKRDSQMTANVCYHHVTYIFKKDPGRYHVYKKLRQKQSI